MMRGFEDSVSYLGSVREGLFERLRSSDIGDQLDQAALRWAVYLASCLRSYVLLRTHGASWEMSAATSELMLTP